MGIDIVSNGRWFKRKVSVFGDPTRFLRGRGWTKSTVLLQISTNGHTGSEMRQAAYLIVLARRRTQSQCSSSISREQATNHIATSPNISSSVHFTSQIAKLSFYWLKVKDQNCFPRSRFTSSGCSPTTRELTGLDRRRSAKLTLSATVDASLSRWSPASVHSTIPSLWRHSRGRYYNNTRWWRHQQVHGSMTRAGHWIIVIVYDYYATRQPH